MTADLEESNIIITSLNKIIEITSSSLNESNNKLIAQNQLFTTAHETINDLKSQLSLIITEKNITNLIIPIDLDVTNNNLNPVLKSGNLSKSLTN